MSIYLGIPVMDGHEWTQRLVANLAETMAGAASIVIVDDDSVEPYSESEFQAQVAVIRNEKSEGFYYPLRKIAAMAETASDLVGIMHNDLIFYERGWDLRLAEAFSADDRLGLVGLCGSNEIDYVGGRGGGTMVYFRGLAQSQAAGLRIFNLRPAVVLDSMFMMFRAGAVRHLRMDQDVPTLAHFYDKIWPLRLIEQGIRVAVLGTEIDHWGGITCVANQRFSEACRAWCAERGLPAGADSDPAWGNWNLVMYQEAERRMRSEFQGRLIPCSVGEDYAISGSSVSAVTVAPWSL